MKIRKYILLLTCLVFILGCNSGENKQSSKHGVDSTQLFTPDKVREVTATGKIEPENGIVTLASPSAGIVEKLYKSRGDSVHKGEAIIQLDQALEESRFVQVNSQIPAQRSQIEMAIESVREAELTVRYNRDQWDSAKKLLEKGAETQQNVGDLEQILKKSEIDLSNKQLAVKQTKQRLNELQSQSKVSNNEKNQKLLLAPEDGVILDLFPTVGSAIKQYENYADFAKKGAIVVRAEVDELFAHKIKSGQKVTVRLIGNTDTLTTGTVQFVSPYLKKKSLFQEQASDMEDRRVREISVMIEQNENLLLNTKVECIISL
jgi:HlyD family secretion protein